MIKAQPLLYVRDVPASSAWYCTVLGATSGHGGDEYERVMSGDAFVLQLHSWSEAHHHGAPGDPAAPVGNGVIAWFAVDDFDAAVKRATKVKASVITAPHRNPNANQMEIWLRDPDGYVVVLAGPPLA